MSMSDAAKAMRFAVKPALLKRMADERHVEPPAVVLNTVRVNGRLYTSRRALEGWLGHLTDVGWPENAGFALELGELRRLDLLTPWFRLSVSRCTAWRWATEGVEIGASTIRIPHARIGRVLASTPDAVARFFDRWDELTDIEADRVDSRGLRPHRTALARCLGRVGSVAQPEAHVGRVVLQDTGRRGAGSNPATASGRAAGSAAADRVANVVPAFGPS